MREFYTDIDYNQNRIVQGAFEVLSTPPVSPVDGQFYYDSSYGSLMIYDDGRVKWLSSEVITIQVGRNGNVGAGSSFRIQDVPTNDSPIYLSRDLTLVGMEMSFSLTEEFVFGLEDISPAGSGNTFTLTVDDGAGGATRVFEDMTLNQDYDAGDWLDAYVDNTQSGNIRKPNIQLHFRWRK